MITLGNNRDNDSNYVPKASYMQEHFRKLLTTGTQRFPKNILITHKKIKQMEKKP